MKYNKRRHNRRRNDNARNKRQTSEWRHQIENQGKVQWTQHPEWWLTSKYINIKVWSATHALKDLLHEETTKRKIDSGKKKMGKKLRSFK